MSYYPLLILLLVLVLNAYASYRVLLDEPPATPRFWLQMGLVWLLPMLGAGIVVFVKGMQDAHPAVSREGFDTEYNYPGQEGSIPMASDSGGDGGGGGD